MCQLCKEIKVKKKAGQWAGFDCDATILFDEDLNEYLALPLHTIFQPQKIPQNLDYNIAELHEFDNSPIFIIPLHKECIKKSEPAIKNISDEIVKPLPYSMTSLDCAIMWWGSKMIRNW